MLVREGYDVWLENWRGSIDLKPNDWDLDKAALNDHPAAVQKVMELTGAKELKAIIHCQRSTSFMISAMVGLLPGVKLIISNAVSLHPVVLRYSEFKLNVYLPLISPAFRFLAPSWGLEAPDLKSKLLRFVVASTHHEADTMVGKFVSFTYGAGFPALWLLENLDDKTMNWIQHEFAQVPITFFNHIRQCVKEGVLRPNKSSKEIQYKNYLRGTSGTDARMVLFGGKKNLCFLSESQENTFAYFDQQRKDYHQLYLLENYSHLDVFLGKNAHKDVFPLMLKELNAN